MVCYLQRYFSVSIPPTLRLHHCKIDPVPESTIGCRIKLGLNVLCKVRNVYIEILFVQSESDLEGRREEEKRRRGEEQKGESRGHNLPSNWPMTMTRWGFSEGE